VSGLLYIYFLLFLLFSFSSFLSLANTFILQSFLTAGASAVYLFLYSIFYFVTTLEIEQFVSGLLYFGYTLIIAIAFFVLTGTIGFYACYYFVRKIYSSIHVD
jgi:hypothetical protein